MNLCFSFVSESELGNRNVIYEVVLSEVNTLELESLQQADDLAQEVFIKCYYRISTYSGKSTLKAWLLTIARNTVFSYRKSRFFRSGLWGGLQPFATEESGEQTSTDPRGVAHSAEMEYLSNRHIDEIWDIIMELSDKFREVLVLDLKHELSIKGATPIVNSLFGIHLQD